MSESLEDRLARQREAKKFEDERNRKEQELTRAKRESERKFTNPQRHEDAVKRFQELRNPSPAPAKAVSPSPTTFAPIKLYAWKNGLIGTATLAMISDFTPLPS